MKRKKRNILMSLLLVAGVTCIGLPFSRSGGHLQIVSCNSELMSSCKRRQLAGLILSNPDFSKILVRAKTVVGTGLNAGDTYHQVWIRDLNTFIELALEGQNIDVIRKSLIMFFYLQGNDGSIVDYYLQAPEGSSQSKSAAIRSIQGKPLEVDKNTVETDQETSLVQAVYKYVQSTKDRSILDEIIDGIPAFERLSMALNYVLQHRFDEKYGLVWGATTCDWGDVQPEHEWGTKLDKNSHRAIDIYDNAMFVIAASNLAELLGPTSEIGKRWQKASALVRGSVRRFLWDDARHKFRPHIYLDGSPFPDDFEENRIYFHGGTSVAIEAGLLSGEEVSLVFHDMINNKRFAGATSIGLTLYPPYPKGFFRNPGMGPFSYQNGGDWTWFGARMIQQLVLHGYIAEAYAEVLPMVKRVERNKGFFEWYTIDNQPQGSGLYKGSAGELAKAVKMLQEWAFEHQK